jgi:hypothetical protein
MAAWFPYDMGEALQIRGLYTGQFGQNSSDVASRLPLVMHASPLSTLALDYL